MLNKEIISQSTLDGNVLFLPSIQLDRKTYLELNKELEFLGGKWNRGKGGFVFDRPITIDELLNNNENKKDLQLFETPIHIIDLMLEYAELDNYQTVLEPSAGRGAIIKEINARYSLLVDYYELSETNRKYLNDLHANYCGDDFLKADDKLYSRIIANPPFSKNQDIDHILKMYGKLDKGGILVSVCSTHYQFCKNKKETDFGNFLEYTQAEVINLEAGDFKESGTSVKACIIVFRKEK